MRLDHDRYFAIMAKVASLRSTCLSRQIGAVLVDENNYVLSTGYNGPAKGYRNCSPCKRENFPSGSGLEQCMAIHAEQNALLQCPDVRRIHTIYVTISPCFTCIKLLMNTPCQRVVYVNTYPHPESELVWVESGRKWDKVQFPTKARDILESLSEIPKLIV